MKTRNRLLVPSLATVALLTWGSAPVALAEGSETGWYSTEPAGKTLPAGVAQIRAIQVNRSANAQYDADGNKTGIPYDITASANGAAFELGLTNRLSFQVYALQYTKQTVKLRSADDLRATTQYQAAYDTAVAAQVAQQAAALQALGACPSAAVCSAAISSGAALDPTTGLPILTLIQSAVDTAIVDAAENAYADGETGLGDTQVGFLYALIPSGAVQSSIGLGMTMPTGKYKDVPDTMRTTGRGVTEAGVQFNLDILPFRGLTLSLQNTSGQMIQKGKKAGADGTDVDVERDGMRSYGFARAAFGLGVFGSWLVPVGLTATYGYDNDSKEKVDNEVTKEKVTRKSMATGVRLDFYSTWKIPVRIDFEQERTLGATNNYNLSGTTAQLKLLLKF